MKTQRGTMKNHENPPGTLKNHEKPTWNHEKPWKPTENHEKPTCYHEKPWKPTRNPEQLWTGEGGQGRNKQKRDQGGVTTDLLDV